MAEDNIGNKKLNGKELSEKWLKKICASVKKMPRKLGLAAVLIGDNPSSHLYVRLKKEACEKCDIHFHRYSFNDDYSEEELIKVIKFLNNDDEINGILVQLPLPQKYDPDKIIQAIDPRKDVDGLHPETREKFCLTCSGIVSPLVLGIVELLNSTKEVIKNKKIAILCNHKVFGEPFFCFYGADNEINVLTPTEVNYQKQLKNADIVIVAIGRPKFINAEMIKDRAIVDRKSVV